MGGARSVGPVAGYAPPNSPSSYLGNVASAHSRNHRVHRNGDLHSGDVHLVAESKPLDFNKVCRTLSHERRGNKYCDVLGCYRICSNSVLLSRGREREVRESQLEKQLAQAQLQVLQMQLHPHFLFNSLHIIGALIQDEPEAAEQMLLDLGSLLRVFLEGQSSQEITLRRELHLVKLYMGIQQVRFRDRLKVTSLVAPEALECSVPSLLLQPIVENAIVHGISKNPGRDTIEINARVDGFDLVIEVANHNSSLCPGVTSDGSGFRVGLSNTKQRLSQIYGETANIELCERSPHGVVCRIVIPARNLNASTVAEEEALAL